MPDDPLPSTGRRSREDALHLGPRKKASVFFLAPAVLRLRYLDTIYLTVAILTRWSPMVVTSVARFTPYVIFSPY
jgi:hypothetical protein